MITLQQVKLPISHTKEELEKKILKTLRIKKEELLGYEIRKQSLDARKKPELFFVYTIDASVKKEETVIKKIKENDDFVLYRYATEQTKGTKITSLLLQFHSTPYPLRLFGTICQSLLKRHCSPGSRSRNSIYLKAVFPSGFHGKRSSTGRC